MFSRVLSIQPGFPVSDVVTVECDVTPRGLYAFSVVGLPDKAVEEARDRLSSAIKHTGFTSPKGKNHKVVISLAPADVKKEGAVFDLPMAMAYLTAAEELAFDPSGIAFLGELSLDGKLRAVRGILAAALTARAEGLNALIVPEENAREAALVQGIDVYGARTLEDVVEHVSGNSVLEKAIPDTHARVAPYSGTDFADVSGQESAKRALEIAAAGRHNVAFVGPPGTGKTMLASALSGILPPLSFEEAIEVTTIHSVAGTLKETLITTPPFRSPHHTSSYVALVGGGAALRPGEVTLAHRGVLFLDEFPEFDRRAIESLREPLENRMVTVSRAAGSVTFPANIMLIAAMNPPAPHADPREIQRFEKKLSGAIVDRIDVWVEVPNVPHEKLAKPLKSESSESLRARIRNARALQTERMKSLGVKGIVNSELPSKVLGKEVGLTDKASVTLTSAAKTLSLSPRSYHRIIRLARTIADIAGDESILEAHILEALQYRPRLKSF